MHQVLFTNISFCFSTFAILIAYQLLKFMFFKTSMHQNLCTYQEAFGALTPTFVMQKLVQMGLKLKAEFEGYHKGRKAGEGGGGSMKRGVGLPVGTPGFTHSAVGCGGPAAWGRGAGRLGESGVPLPLLANCSILPSWRPLPLTGFPGGRRWGKARDAHPFSGTDLCIACQSHDARGMGQSAPSAGHSMAPVAPSSPCLDV